MFRDSYLFKFSAMVLILTIFALPAVAQKTTESGKRVLDQKKIAEQRRPLLSLDNVVKRDADAKNEGAKRLVPVDFHWQTNLPGSAKLVELEAVLKTRNTDSKTSLVEELIDITEFKPGGRQVGMLILPMDQGVFAKDFNLTLNAKFRVKDQIITESVSKSGSFPPPLGLIERKK